MRGRGKRGSVFESPDARIDCRKVTPTTVSGALTIAGREAIYIPFAIIWNVCGLASTGSAGLIALLRKLESP